MTLARRTITIVFCDVVESTTLGESMDPELLRQVITRYFEEMQRILASYDGTVEKFIGDAVMGAFGIPVLHEDDALRAVTAAVDMQGAIEGLNRDLKTQRGLQLQVRIGVNTGEVVTGDPSAAHGFVSGDPVNVAARLQQQSSPGEILIGEQTYQLVRDAIDADDVGALELKGKARPMRAYRVCDVQRGSLGRWRRLDSPLVGRATEMRSLNEAFSLVIEQGSPSLMSVLGHPGTGKTRLTQEFLSEVTGHAHVLKARFLPYGQIGALRPLAESIEDYCAIDEKDSVGEVTRKLAGVVEKDDDRDLVVTRLLALLERTAEAPDIQDLFWAFRRFCEAIGRVRPVILFLDDLHWAESSVLDLVEYMSAFARVPLLVLCTARLSLRDEQRPTWGQGQPTLVLDRLSDDEVKQLCRILTEGCSLPIELENRIVDMAEGNPLYVEELVRALIDAGLMERTESGWQVVGDIADLEIPPSIGALVAARLDRLTSEERTILERASVVGGSFWWKSLNVVLPPELGPQAGRHLHTLMKKELLEADLSLGSDDAFRFKHEVVRRMAYVGLAKELRSELHERVARWMVGLSSGATSEEQIAFHLEQSVRLRRALGTADDHTEEMARKASALLDATGQKALNLSDVATAIGVLRRAVDLLPEDGDRGRLSIDLAGALLESGDLASARDELELVLGRPECTQGSDLWARAFVQKRAIVDYLGSDDGSEDALPALDQLARIFETNGDRLWLGRAEYQKANLHWDRYELSATEAALERALICARVAESPCDIARVLGSMTAVLLLGPQPVPEAIIRCEEIIALPETSLLVKAKSLLRLAGLKAMQEEFPTARGLIEEGRSLLQDLGHNFALAASSHEAGMVEVLAEDHAAAEAEFRAGIAKLEAMQEKATLASSAAFLSRVLYTQERYDEALEWTWTSEAAWNGDSLGIVEWGPTRAKLTARAGDIDEAKALALAALEPVASSDDILTRTHSLLGVADVLLIAGRNRAALPYLEEVVALYRRKGILSLEKSILRKLDAAIAA